MLTGPRRYLESRHCRSALPYSEIVIWFGNFTTSCTRSIGNLLGVHLFRSAHLCSYRFSVRGSADSTLTLSEVAQVCHEGEAMDATMVPGQPLIWTGFDGICQFSHISLSGIKFFGRAPILSGSCVFVRAHVVNVEKGIRG